MNTLRQLSLTRRNKNMHAEAIAREVQLFLTRHVHPGDQHSYILACADILPYVLLGIRCITNY